MKTVERIMLELAVISAFALAVMITVNVIARAVFGWTVPDVVIIVRELMIPTIMLPLAAATANRAHIAVTFLTDRMNAKMRGRMIVLGWFVALIALLPLMYAGTRALSAAWSSGEFYDGQLGLPRWPMKLVFLVGLAAMWVRLAMIAASDMIELRRTGAVSDRAPIKEEAI